jgi:hypothetical protein
MEEDWVGECESTKMNGRKNLRRRLEGWKGRGWGGIGRVEEE